MIRSNRLFRESMRGRSVRDESVRPVVEVTFVQDFRTYAAIAYGPEEDGALDVTVFRVYEDGSFSYVGCGTWAKTWLPFRTSWPRGRKDLVEDVRAALGEREAT